MTSNFGFKGTFSPCHLGEFTSCHIICFVQSNNTNV